MTSSPETPAPATAPTPADPAQPSAPAPRPPLAWPDRLFVAFATGFGAGFSPRAPGTVGTLVGVLFHVAIARLLPWVQLVTIAALIALAIYAAGRAARHFGDSDDGRIVSDEIVGYLVTMLFVPPEPLYLAAGFVLFRAFDILKPWPCSFFDQKRHDAVGNVMDDVCAGIYARLLLLAWMLIWN